MTKIVLASNNDAKVREFSELLAGQCTDLVPLSCFSDVSPLETGQSFVENAILKARFAARCSGLPALADDSGLVVSALNGAPGIYSARYAGVSATDQENLEKLLLALDKVPQEHRGAYFYSAIVLVRDADDAVPVIAEGRWDGSILHEPVGLNGFGYDPVFSVADEFCSAAELSATKKNELSHRGRALRQLLARLGEGALLQ